MAHNYTITKIIGRTFQDSTIRVSLQDKNGGDVLLTMSPKLAGELIDNIAALNDEIMSERERKIPGMTPKAYRNIQNISATMDATGARALIEFDPREPHRVAVAVPMENMDQFVDLMKQIAERGRLFHQTQKRQ